MKGGERCVSAAKGKSTACRLRGLKGGTRIRGKQQRERKSGEETYYGFGKKEKGGERGEVERARGRAKKSIQKKRS